MTAFKSLYTRVLPPPPHSGLFLPNIKSTVWVGTSKKTKPEQMYRGRKVFKWAPAAKLCRGSGTWGPRCGQFLPLGKEMLVRTFLGYWRVRDRTAPPDPWVSSSDTRKKLPGQKEDAPLPPSFQSEERLLPNRGQKHTRDVAAPHSTS